MKVIDLIKKAITGQKGMTVLELLAGMALSGMILPVAASSVLRLMADTELSRNRIVALQDMAYAANQVKGDIRMAQSTDLVNDSVPVGSVIFSWEDSSTGVSHSVSYYLSGNRLQRSSDGINTTVGWYVSDVEFSLSGNIVKMQLKSSPGVRPGSVQQLTYHFALT